MRTIAAVLLFVTTGIATASAQQQGSWSMDHGHAADAAAAVKSAAAALNFTSVAVEKPDPLTTIWVPGLPCVGEKPVTTGVAQAAGPARKS